VTSTGQTSTTDRLRSLPRSERREALQALVVTEFKATLLMPEDEELPLDSSFFELGFTSLRVTEAKQRLEDLLDITISATVLFNSPTVEHLMAHLTAEVFGDAAGAAPEPVTATGGPDAETRALLDDLLTDL
jgi:acyl carrier protein